MRIQGWGLQATAALHAGFPDETAFARRMNDPSSSVSPYQNQHTEPDRLEFLKTIRRRIKSGFYNSESVIDDLGHGFAQALNESL